MLPGTASAAGAAFPACAGGLRSHSSAGVGSGCTANPGGVMMALGGGMYGSVCVRMYVLSGDLLPVARGGTLLLTPRLAHWHMRGAPLQRCEVARLLRAHSIHTADALPVRTMGISRRE